MGFAITYLHGPVVSKSWFLTGFKQVLMFWMLFTTEIQLKN